MIAVACVESAPIGFISKLLVYLMVAVHCFFMLIMTVSVVCSSTIVGYILVKF